MNSVAAELRRRAARGGDPAGTAAMAPGEGWRSHRSAVTTRDRPVRKGPGRRGAEAAPRRVVAGRRLRRWGGLLLVALAVLGAVAAQWSAAEAGRAATAARADREAVAARLARAEATVDARLAALGPSFAAAADASSARQAQRARLVEMQLAEDTLTDVVATARQDTAAVEAERQGLDEQVHRQGADLPQLEGCLAEVRPLLDAAFLAATDPDLVVPSVSPACRALLDALSRAGG